MSYSIRDHRLYRDGRAVDLMASPHTGGTFAAIPRLLVIHFTAGASARSSAEWFRSPQNRPGSSAHLVIDRDGAVIQCVGFDTVAWHAGRSRWRDLVGLNQYAFGIELANWGNLVPRGGWTSHTGVRIEDPVMAVHRHGNPDGSRTPIGWEPYPEAQFQAAAAIARELVVTYGVDEIIGHDDIAPTRKWDPGPAFDMDRFRALVLGGRGADDDRRMTVQVASGLNLRRGPGLQHEILKLLPQGTVLDPEETEGNWVQVTVIDAQGRPDQTGWVHGRYIG